MNKFEVGDIIYPSKATKPSYYLIMALHSGYTTATVMALTGTKHSIFKLNLSHLDTDINSESGWTKVEKP